MKLKRMKLQSSGRSWKVLVEVEKFVQELESSTSEETFQLRSVVANFARFFSISLGYFSLRSVLSSFARFFPTSLGSFQLQQKLSNLRLANFSFFQLPFQTTRNPNFGLKTSRSNALLRLNFGSILQRIRQTKSKFIDGFRQTDFFGSFWGVLEDAKKIFGKFGFLTGRQTDFQMGYLEKNFFSKTKFLIFKRDKMFILTPQTLSFFIK